MFDKIWNILFKKNSEQDFRKGLFKGLIALVVLLVELGFIYWHAQPWYPKTILLILAGLVVIHLYAYTRALVDKAYFKKLYINIYDERNKEIIKLSVVSSYVMVMMVVIYHFGDAFGAELVILEPKMISLSGFCATLLGTGISGFFGSKLILQKFY